MNVQRKLVPQADTRTRILDAAQDAVLVKGFEATSIDEIVAAAEITKGGFFYHFADKSALAVALIERSVDREDEILDDHFGRARELTDDPLQVLLIATKFLAELLADMPKGHPGCIVATAAYQDRGFKREVRDANRRAALRWRARFRAALDDIVAVYEPRDDVSLDDLADMATSILEGGIVMAKALGEPHAIVGQLMLFRSYLKLLFSPVRKAA